MLKDLHLSLATQHDHNVNASYLQNLEPTVKSEEASRGWPTQPYVLKQTLDAEQPILNFNEPLDLKNPPTSLPVLQLPQTPFFDKLYFNCISEQGAYRLLSASNANAQMALLSKLYSYYRGCMSPVSSFGQMDHNQPMRSQEYAKSMHHDQQPIAVTDRASNSGGIYPIPWVTYIPFCGGSHVGPIYDYNEEKPEQSDVGHKVNTGSYNMLPRFSNSYSAKDIVQHLNHIISMTAYHEPTVSKDISIQSENASQFSGRRYFKQQTTPEPYFASPPTTSDMRNNGCEWKRLENVPTTPVIQAPQFTEGGRHSAQSSAKINSCTDYSELRSRKASRHQLVRLVNGELKAIEQLNVADFLASAVAEENSKLRDATLDFTSGHPKIPITELSWVRLDAIGKHSDANLIKLLFNVPSKRHRVVLGCRERFASKHSVRMLWPRFSNKSFKVSG
ncbi:unnamed protein product [Dicrocoelium dendriticum]|nr:unnamed protein product [Dicrocoelium dendriticum]